MKLSRRMMLRGVGGAVLALPWLESFGPRRAQAQMSESQGFAIFFRQANGVACEQDSPLTDGVEPERFWPKADGALTPDNMSGRAVDELVDYRDRLLIVRNLHMHEFRYNDGHAIGALQGLTAQGPTVEGSGGNAEAAGMSIDHRIGLELNPEGRDSLFLYAGKTGGWLGGPCISYRAAGQRRGAFRSPLSAYESFAGVASVDGQAAAQLATGQKSINDLVRDQMQRLMGMPRLSRSDRDRLDLHFSAVRDLEMRAACQMEASRQAELAGGEALYDSTDGRDVIATAKLHMQVATLAVACGHTRSVAIQIGTGNDGFTRYLDPDTGNLMETYHHISHRRPSDDAAVIPDSDMLHHKVDRQFGQMFKYLLDQLSEYTMPDGKTLLEHGAAIWHNDNGNGPGHYFRRIPFIVAGSGNGYLKQGETINITDGEANHVRALRTVARAAGVTSDLDDFGDAMLPKGELPEMTA